MKKFNVAIAGATGAVGTEMIRVLEERNFPIGELRLLASKRSAGKEVMFKGQAVVVQELTKESFKNIDIALFSAGGSRSKEFAPIAVQDGALVIDNSSAFRMDPKVPLVVPEINPDAAKEHQGIIANPNCTTIIMGVALYPIHQHNPIKRIDIASYQAVSGAGAVAVEELKNQQKAAVQGQSASAEVFKHVIVNNVFSHDSDILENGFNQEEMKMVNETHKIFANDSIQVCPTCVRVPIERAHSEAIHIQLQNPVDLKQIKSWLSDAPGIYLQDDAAQNHFPMPLDVSGKDDVAVGRLRKDLFNSNAMSLFVCGDQLLKGAALNAVQIAELFV